MRQSLGPEPWPPSLPFLWAEHQHPGLLWLGHTQGRTSWTVRDRRSQAVKPERPEGREANSDIPKPVSDLRSCSPQLIEHTITN